jgi:hypothetical protein
MKLNEFGINASLDFLLRDSFDQHKIELQNTEQKNIFKYNKPGIEILFKISSGGGYSLSLDSEKPVSVKMDLIPDFSKKGYHVIPCNIHGDNNLRNARPGFFPNLTELYPESMTSSTEWEFRADRASHPVSMVHTESRTFGISIDPYTLDSDGTLIRNGVYSKLPATAGVSLGYRNTPYTFTFKELFEPPTFHLACNAYANGKIYEVPGNRIESVSLILRDLYMESRICPEPMHNSAEYLRAFLDSYENINWSDEWMAFTNMECQVPDSTELKPWRPLVATGWTGTCILAYPLLSAQKLLNLNDSFTDKLINQLDTAALGINPATGMLYDLTRELNGSRFNGWWAGYMVSDCHCAYTNGNGAYYLLKSYLLMKENGIDKPLWLSAARSTIDTVITLQRRDGNYGYTYSIDKPEMLDADGFAGCWFAAASALLYTVTDDYKYLESAEKAMAFYHSYVINLDCWGAPMDTWKSIDQEGNLAFIKAAAALHRITGNEKYKKMLIDGADYEYLWRYAYKAIPEYAPLKDSTWNSCGGSVTSVSNPHIHPMGVNITAELIYLYKITGDSYHQKRAEDGLCWGLATADLYPDTTGYGKLGVISERWCPSDGLVIEKFSDTGEPSSVWFTFNGWAGVSIIEGLTEPFLRGLSSTGVDKNPGIHDIFNEITQEVSK